MERFAVLGQVTPAASAVGTLYTVPAGRAAVISSLVVCNRGAVAGGFTIHVRPGGAAAAAHHILHNVSSLAANATQVVGAGITLAATDVVSVVATTAEFNFSLFGSEITV